MLSFKYHNMKQNNNIMNNLTTKSTFLGLLIMIMSSLALNAQSNSAKQQPFPKFIHTGNPELDKKNHEKAIIEWKKAEADRKSGLKQDNSKIKATPSQSETKVERREASKKVDRSVPKSNIYTNGKVLRTKKIINQPHAPSYQYTGNEKVDNANYSQKKAEWAANYPDEYKRALKANKSSSSTLKRKPTTNK